MDKAGPCAAAFESTDVLFIIEKADIRRTRGTQWCDAGELRIRIRTSADLGTSYRGKPF